MKCPYCSFQDSRVIETREGKDGFVIRRRRECLECRERFTTKEYIEKNVIHVLKSDGRTEEFELEKLTKSLRIACQKRLISSEHLEEIVNDIFKEIQNKFTKVVKSVEIGEIVMAKLKTIDKIAYVRFASVYRNFEDVSEFTKEIDNLEKNT
ncbi:MAG: transcriptional repressor NrdR [Calditrichaeota bacterium]|nr:MAG: transcriptional repressor NrdR [Calditrichota bacterium]